MSWNELPTELWTTICDKCDFETLIQLSYVDAKISEVVHNHPTWKFCKKIKEQHPQLKSWHQINSFPNEITYLNCSFKLKHPSDNFRFLESCVSFLNYAESNQRNIFSILDWLMEYLNEKMVAELLHSHRGITKNLINAIFMNRGFLLPRKKYKFDHKKLFLEYYYLIIKDSLNYFDALSQLLAETTFPRRAGAIYEIVVRYWSELLFNNVPESKKFETVDTCYHFTRNLIYLSFDLFYTKAERRKTKAKWIEAVRYLNITNDFLNYCYDRSLRHGLGCIFISDQFYIKKTFGKNVPVEIKVKPLYLAPTIFILRGRRKIFSVNFMICDFKLTQTYLLISSLSQSDLRIKIYSDYPNHLENTFFTLLSAQEQITHKQEPSLVARTDNPVKYIIEHKASPSKVKHYEVIL